MSLKIVRTEFLKLSYYGDSDNYEFMIICPHSFEGLSFLSKFPEIIDAVNLTTFELCKYLAIEQDFGTNELGSLIAEVCYEDYGINCLIVEPLFPRSILDPGRIYPQCLRNIIDYSKHPDLKSRLMKIHTNYLNTLDGLIIKLNKSNGFALDLHTMSPYSPVQVGKSTYSEAILETPDNLRDYIDAYLESHIYGNRREIQFLTGDPDANVFSNLKFVENITIILNYMGYDVEYDMPYLIAPHLMGYRLMQTTEVACIDIPKDLVSVYDVYDEHFDLSDLLIDHAKIDKLAHGLAKAIYLTIKGEKI